MGLTPRGVGSGLAVLRCGSVRLPPDAAVQQPQAVVGEVAEAVPDPLDLLIWNGAVKWGTAGEQLLTSPWWIGFEVAAGGGRAEVGQDRVGAAWIGGPPL
jgi:hypothetical protein